MALVVAIPHRSAPFRLRCLAAALAAAALTLTVAGCAGQRPMTSGLQQPIADPVAGRHFRLDRLVPGKEVTATLRDGGSARGRYRGVVRLEPGEYDARVKRFLAERGEGTPLPAPGSTVQVRRGGGAKAARLDGYGWRGVEVTWPGFERSESLALDDLDSLDDGAGHVWTRAALEVEAESGRLPAITALEIDTGDAVRRIPFDEVTAIGFREPPPAMLVAPVVLLVAAVVVLGAFLANITLWGPS